MRQTGHLPARLGSARIPRPPLAIPRIRGTPGWCVPPHAGQREVRRIVNLAFGMQRLRCGGRAVAARATS
jgi:hypothetical protein